MESARKTSSANTARLLSIGRGYDSTRANRSLAALFRASGYRSQPGQSWSWLNGSSSNGEHEPAVNSTFDPIKLSSWTEFHEYVEKLPEEERILFDLLWYEGLTLQEAADLCRHV